MSRTSLPSVWFRMYAEFATDPKVQMLSEADQRRFVMLLCIRCSNGDVTLHDNEIAFQLRIDETEWARTKTLLIGKNLIDQDNKPTAWDKRQYASDSSAERVAKHRQNKKQQCNNDVTLQSRPVEAEAEADTDKPTLVSAVGEDETEIEIAGNKIPPCPFDSIVAAYHESLPVCPAVKVLNDIRRKHIRARWRERFVEGKYTDRDGGVRYFLKLFRYAADSPFLTGRVKGRDGAAPFMADLEFLMQPSHFARLIEGRYHQGAEK